MNYASEIIGQGKRIMLIRQIPLIFLIYGGLLMEKKNLLQRELKNI